jgi:hypothetical protein
MVADIDCFVYSWLQTIPSPPSSPSASPSPIPLLSPTTRSHRLLSEPQPHHLPDTAQKRRQEEEEWSLQRKRVRYALGGLSDVENAAKHPWYIKHVLADLEQPP